MADISPQDSRKFFMLPQAPEGAGYYVYGTPAKGAAQYAHPAMMTLLLMVEREWALIDKRKFGIGNISIDAIGPDLKDACGTTLGMRQRQRGDLDCSYDKEQRGSAYTCHFGIDLRKGKSIAGSTC